MIVGSSIGIKSDGEYGYWLKCDFCGRTIPDRKAGHIMTYKGAVEIGKMMGWKSVEHEGVLLDKCSRCQKEERMKHE